MSVIAMLQNNTFFNVTIVFLRQDVIFRCDLASLLEVMYSVGPT